MSESGYIMFLFEYTEFVTLNLVPIEESQPMKVDLEYRLINNEEEQFFLETMALMIVGFILILVFMVILFKALDVN